MAKVITAEEFEKFMWQFKLLIAGTVLVFVLPLVLYAFYMDRRLDSFEDSLRYKPPQVVEEHVANSDTNYLTDNPVQGQVVYVPAYSHIYHDDGDPYLLTITLSVRNTSLDNEIVVKSVRYFDTKGKEVKSYLTKPLRLPALATTEFLVERDDATGGSGANFLVEWVAIKEVTEPIIEAVMIDTKGQQGISFARSGKPVREVVTKEDARAENKGTLSTSTETE
tara:strand:- start:25348 stop:26016 length:669 start_codon:yes stop_codon:yes gene_type:complete